MTWHSVTLGLISYDVPWLFWSSGKESQSLCFHVHDYDYDQHLTTLLIEEDKVENSMSRIVAKQITAVLFCLQYSHCFGEYKIAFLH